MNFNSDNNGVFIVHALKGYEFHENRIIDLFKKSGIPFDFFTAGDPSLFSEELLNKYFIKEIKKELSDGVLSCTLNHILIYKEIVSRQLDYAIVFENDPFLLVDFIPNFDPLLKEIKSLNKGLIVSLENSTLRFPSYWQTKKNIHLYKANSGRMAGAYYIDLEAATQILGHLKKQKCHTVIDWWHNRLIDDKVINMYWAHPPLVEQGSHNGRMSSTISTKPDNINRRIKWFFQKNIKYYIGRLFNEKRIIDVSKK